MVKFAVLSEKNGKEGETFYHFIRYDNNEKVLNDLHDQLKKFTMDICGDNSIFTLDIENLVDESTVDQFLKIDTINSYMNGTKIEGILNFIDLFDLSESDGQNNYNDNMEACHWNMDRILCYGGIEKYVIDN